MKPSKLLPLLVTSSTCGGGGGVPDGGRLNSKVFMGRDGFKRNTGEEHPPCECDSWQKWDNDIWWCAWPHIWRYWEEVCWLYSMFYIKPPNQFEDYQITVILNKISWFIEDFIVIILGKAEVTKLRRPRPWILNSKGPRMEPCRTPDFTVISPEKLSMYWTLWMPP